MKSKSSSCASPATTTTSAVEAVEAAQSVDAIAASLHDSGVLIVSRLLRLIELMMSLNGYHVEDG